MLSAKFFKTDTEQKKVIFIGDKLEVFIPCRFENYGCLRVENGVMSLCVFDMLINGEHACGMLLPAIIRMAPSEVKRVREDANEIMHLLFHKGDMFMSTETVQNGALGYVIFNELIKLGRLPNFLAYHQVPQIFDMIEKVTGTNFFVDHAIFEIIFAFMTRSAKDFTIPYRLTDLKGVPTFVPLSAIAQLATTTTSRLLGPYLDQTLDVALTKPATQTNAYEELITR